MPRIPLTIVCQLHVFTLARSAGRGEFMRRAPRFLAPDSPRDSHSPHPSSSTLCRLRARSEDNIYGPGHKSESTLALCRRGAFFLSFHSARARASSSRHKSTRARARAHCGQDNGNHTFSFVTAAAAIAARARCRRFVRLTFGTRAAQRERGRHREMCGLGARARTFAM